MKEDTPMPGWAKKERGRESEVQLTKRYKARRQKFQGWPLVKDGGRVRGCVLRQPPNHHKCMEPSIFFTQSLFSVLEINVQLDGILSRVMSMLLLLVQSQPLSLIM